MWATFSSTSPDMNTTKAFLSKKKYPENNEEKKKAMGGSSVEKTLK